MRYMECRVVYIDTKRNVLDVRSADGMNYFEDVSYLDTGLKKSGEVYHPEIGDMVMCNLVEDGQVELIGFYFVRKTDSNNLVNNVVGKADIGIELPGDRILSGPDGAILKLLRGGYAGIGASPLAQTMYLAIEGLVRTVAQNYELISAGTKVYSTNDAGNITTRCCFNSKEKFFSEGANKNEGAEAENFEYQVEFTESGFNIMVGEIGEDGKRVNNLMINMKQNGDVRITCGKLIVFDLYSNGSMEINMVDKDSNLVYNKSVSSLSSGKVFVNEVVIGDTARYVEGSVTEEIGGDYNLKANTIKSSATIIDSSSTLNNKTTGINMNSIGL